MVNETMLKFGFPKTLLREYDFWMVLVRPQQITAGCLILVCKGEVTRLPNISAQAYAELALITFHVEQTLSHLFSFDKINYLLLMMRDKHVHFHIIPRYATPRIVCGIEFVDASWPRQPDITEVNALTDSQFDELTSLLKSNWPQ